MSRVTIPVEQLPPPNSKGDHVVQFRVVSEDRNRISAWSPLYTIKSIGQYRPLQSDIVAIIATNDVTITWDTPTVYNYSEISPSASIAHNHSQNFKQHQSDIFVQWGSGSAMGNFQYHDRVDSDSSSLLIPDGSASVRVLGIVALKDIPQREDFENSQDFQARLDEFLGISASANSAYSLFKVFDTDVISLTWYN